MTGDSIIAGRTLKAWYDHAQALEARATAKAETKARAEDRRLVVVDLVSVLAGVPLEVQAALQHYRPETEARLAYEAEMAAQTRAAEAAKAEDFKTEQARLTPEERRAQQAARRARRQARRQQDALNAHALSVKSKAMRRLTR